MGDELDEVVEPVEIAGVARVKGQLVRDRRGSDKEVDGAAAARRSSLCCRCCEDGSVGAGAVTVERERVVGRLDDLEVVLATRSLVGVVGRVRPSCQLGEAER